METLNKDAISYSYTLLATVLYIYIYIYKLISVFVTKAFRCILRITVRWSIKCDLFIGISSSTYGALFLGGTSPCFPGKYLSLLFGLKGWSKL